MSVCAVVGGSAPAPSGVDVVRAERLRAGVERALAGGADWLWVLDGTALPRAGALEALLEGLERVDGLPAPSLLTGVIVGPDGRVDPNRTPWYRRFQIDVALSSADQGLAPVRGSTGPVLVHRDAAAADLPRPRARLAPGPLLEWTAYVLRERTGYLVAESESDALDTRPDPMRTLATAARLLLGRPLRRLDRVGFALELSERLGLR